MCRSKVCVALLLAACLLSGQAVAQSPNLIPEDMIVSNTVNYNTAEVEYGSIQQGFSIKGEVYLPYTYDLYPKVSGLKFDGYTVDRGDVVKEGDVLAVFLSNVDEAALEEKKLLLERTGDAFELERQSRQEAIDKMHMSLLGVRDSYEAQMLKLKLQRAELAFEQYVWQMETELEDIQKAIDDIEAQREDCVITAPTDGIIAKVVTRRMGDRISRDELMITMYRTDGALIQVNNRMGNLRYGMEVEIKAGNINSQSIPGRVVGVDTMLPEAQQSAVVYVQPAYYDAETTPTTNIKISGQTAWLDNVLTVPRKAVSLETGRHFVMKYEGGMARKRYINAELIRQQVLVLQGLEAGEKIILN